MVEGKKNLPSETETMRLEDGFDALDALMGCLSQSEEWAYIQRHDALALKAEDVLYKQLEQIKASSDFECFEELENAICVYNSTLNDAAILYGLRMALKLSYAFSKPLEMSRYFLNRDTERGVGVGYVRAV